MIASHCKETQDLESFNKKCAQSAEIGMDYLICPGLGRRDLSLETFKNHANTFNKCGAIAKKNGKIRVETVEYGPLVRNNIRSSAVIKAIELLHEELSVN